MRVLVEIEIGDRGTVAWKVTDIIDLSRGGWWGYANSDHGHSVKLTVLPDDQPAEKPAPGRA